MENRNPRDFYSRIMDDKTRKDIDTFLEELNFYTSFTPSRIAIYKYLEEKYDELTQPLQGETSEVKAKVQAYRSKKIYKELVNLGSKNSFRSRILSKSPNKFVTGDTSAQAVFSNLAKLLDFVKKFPKGSSHHDHSYSINYSSLFFDYIYTNDILSKINLKLVFISDPLLLEPEIKDSFCWLYDEEGNCNGNFLLSNELILVPMSMNLNSNGIYEVLLDKTTIPTHYIEPVDFQVDSTSGKGVFTLDIYNSSTRQHEQESSGTLSIQNVLHVLQITKENIELFQHGSKIEQGVKAWSFLEYCADRYKWVVNNYKLLPYRFLFIAQVGKLEGLQNIQIKFTFNIFNWQLEKNTYKIVQYTLNPSPKNLSLVPLSIEFPILDLIARTFQKIRESLGILLHIIVGVARPKNEVEIEVAIQKFKKIHELCLSYFKGDKLNDPVIGYDIYGWEDSNPFKNYHSKMSSALQEFINEYDTDEKRVVFMLHAGESYEFKYSKKGPERSDEGIKNLALALELSPNTRRVGHGLLILNPSSRFLSKYTKAKILVELCPISNNILKFIPDIRTHPGYIYIREKIPVSINTDNRGLLDYDFVSYDWMDFILGSLHSSEHFLTYRKLEKIALDSITYAVLENPLVSNFINETHRIAVKFFESNWKNPSQPISSLRIIPSLFSISSDEPLNIFQKIPVYANTSTEIKGVPGQPLRITTKMLREKLFQNINHMSQSNRNLVELPEVRNLKLLNLSESSISNLNRIPKLNGKSHSIAMYPVLHATQARILNHYTHHKEANRARQFSEFDSIVKEKIANGTLQPSNANLLEKKFRQAPYSTAIKYRNTMISLSKKLRSKIKNVLKNIPKETPETEILKLIRSSKLKITNPETKNILVSELQTHFELEEGSEKLQAIQKELYEEYRRELLKGGTRKKKRIS